MKNPEAGWKNSRFEDMLRSLLEVGNELSRVESVEELCRRVVELGRSKLGLDRFSIWFIDKDPAFISGSFGIDETGQLRYELGERVSIANDPVIKQLRENKMRSILAMDVPLRDHKSKEVGRGTHAVAAIWNGEEVIGYLFTDNLLQKKPFNEEDLELLELYASTFGHLYSLKRTEDALRAASLKLKEIQEQLTQTSKLKIGGEVASGVVHEVKNPLAIIIRGAEYLLEKRSQKTKTDYEILQSMHEAAVRADNIIMGLLDFSKFSKLNITSQNLISLIDSSLSLVKHQLDRYHIEVEKDFKEQFLYVNVDKNKI